MMEKKDYCTWFPEVWRKVDISSCCSAHDSDCSTRKFYLCLKDKIGKFHATYIGFGGSIGCYIKYPKKMIEALKIKYNNKNS